MKVALGHTRALGKLAAALVCALLLLVGLTGISSAATPSHKGGAGKHQTLRKGMTSPAVAKLQSRIGVTPPTGYFGRHTRRHVKRFQTANGLPVTGAFDSKTRHILRKMRRAARRAAPASSPTLGVHASLGRVSAPLTRFRDGGHAYYLFGGGLHSCKHKGRCMDMFAAVGEPVYALADGVLQTPPYARRSFGNHLVLTHADGSESVYAHLNSVTATAGPW